MVLLTGYSQALRALLDSAAAPAGYTITTWGAGAVLLGAQGVPSLLESLGYVAGAALTLAFLRLLGQRRSPAASPTAVDSVAAFHTLSAGVAVAVAAGLAELLDGPVGWTLAAAAATLSFFACSALALSAG